MSPEFAGIERRLDRLNECLQKLEPLRKRPLAEFLTDAYLRDIVERNLEVAAQCCIDIANRIILIPPPAYYAIRFTLFNHHPLSASSAAAIAPVSTPIKMAASLHNCSG